MVIGYNIVFNLLDLIHTHQIVLWFKNSQIDLNAFLNKMIVVKGSIAVFIALFCANPIIIRLGWKYGALFTPIIVAITCFMFFPLVVSQGGYLENLYSSFVSIPLLLLIAYLGAFQNCAVRAAKYVLFDATKEMAYIPLSVSEQRKGKAAIDGLASRIGKSGGSTCYHVMLGFCLTTTAAMPYFISVIAFILSVWVFAIIKLNKYMKKAK